MDMRKDLQKNFLGFAVLVFFLFFIGWSIVKSAKQIMSNNVSVPKKVESYFCRKTVEEYDPSKIKKVVLRLDDVQAFMWSDVSQRIISDTIDLGAPIVAGVIPNGIHDDGKMYNFLYEKRCNMEVAVHGWDHGRELYEKTGIDDFVEFETLNYDEARPLVARGREELQYLGGVDEIITFIPPNNTSSEGTLQSLKDEHFKILSTGDGRLFDYAISTYNSVTREIVSVDDILHTCDEKFSSGEFCVIMLHPLEYAQSDGTLNEKVYQEHYIRLLYALKERDVNFITFRELVDQGFVDDRLK